MPAARLLVKVGGKDPSKHATGSPSDHLESHVDIALCSLRVFAAKIVNAARDMHYPFASPWADFCALSEGPSRS